jgi:hypothetical protein
MSKRVLLYNAPTHAPPHAPLTEQFRLVGNNFGNMLIGYGATQLFSSGSVATLEEFTCPEEINEACTHVVIPVANLLWHGFDLASMLAFIEKLTIPKVMIGVGSQSSNRNTIQPIHPTTLRMLRHIADQCYAVGVRGHSAAEVLAANGILNTAVVGGPSFYMMRKTTLRVSAGSKHVSGAIGVNVSCSINSLSFHPDRSQALDNALLSWALDRDSVFIAQDESEELQFAAGVIDAPKQCLAYFSDCTSSRVCDWLKRATRHFCDVPTWSASVAGKTLSVGSRFHRNLIAVLNGVPALFVIHDSRTRELCSLLGLPSINVSDIGDGIDYRHLITERITDFDYRVFERSYTQLCDRMACFLKMNGLTPAEWLAPDRDRYSALGDNSTRPPPLSYV